MTEQPDYKKYSLAELEDALRWVNRHDYPERFEALTAERLLRQHQQAPNEHAPVSRDGPITRAATIIGASILTVFLGLLLLSFVVPPLLKADEPEVKQQIAALIESSFVSWDSEPLLNAMPANIDREDIRKRYDVLFEVKEKLGKYISHSEPEGKITASLDTTNGYTKIATYSTDTYFKNGRIQIAMQLTWHSKRWVLTSVTIVPASIKSGASNKPVNPAEGAVMLLATAAQGLRVQKLSARIAPAYLRGLLAMR